MTKTNKQILILFIVAFILFNLSIVLNIYFSTFIFSGVPTVDQFLSELIYLLVTFSAIICFITAIFLLMKNNN